MLPARPLLLLLLTLGPLAGACASSEPFVRAEPINQYRAYGEYHPQAEDDAVVARAATADPAGKAIHVFQEALPPGIEMGASTLGVAPGFKHKLLGKYAFSAGKEVSKDELVLHVKKMCVATGANGAIIIFQLVPNDHQDRAQAIEAVLAILDESVLSK
jgi:hypothetical protein